MEDILDVASDISSKQDEQIIALHQEVLRQNNNSSCNCIDCKKEIPQARRDFFPGVNRCIECQVQFEKEVPQKVTSSLLKLSATKDNEEDEDDEIPQDNV